MKSLVAAICLLFVTHVAPAQSAYAGMQTRSIKALSQQQIADLKAGRGMGLALPAELNGYPVEQMQRYSILRGYSSEQMQHHHDMQ